MNGSCFYVVKMGMVVLHVGMNGDADFIIRDPKVYIIYIIRLNNHEIHMAQKGPNQEHSQQNVLLSPCCREKRVGHAVRPPSKHYSCTGKEELSPFLFLSMKVLFQKEY